MGKTNLLDAAYYMGMTKSFFHNRDVYNTLEGQDFFRLEAEIEDGQGKRKAVAKVKPGALKEFSIDKQVFPQLVDYIGHIPVLMSAPKDSELVTSSSVVRRKFIDGLISQIDREYLKSLMAYNRFLRQRNATLKKHPIDFSLVDIYTEKMNGPANYIYQSRKEYLTKMLPVYQSYYKQFAADAEVSDFEYESALRSAKFEDLQKESLQKDAAVGRTSRGTHRDDISIKLNGKPAREFASQGQMKSILFALHLAKYQLMKESLQTTPILLLDDIFDKLDEERIARLLTLLNLDDFGQILITDTNEERLVQHFEDLKISSYIIHRVVSGEIETVQKADDQPH